MRVSFNCMAVLASVSVILAVPASSAPVWQARISKDVLNVYSGSASAQTQSVQSPGLSTAPAQNSLVRFDTKGRLQIDVRFDCAITAPAAALHLAGLSIGTVLKAPPLCVVEGWAATAALPAIASVASIQLIDLPRYAQNRVPLTSTAHATPPPPAMPQSAAGATVIDGNGVSIMKADQYIAQTGANGAGISVGVINTGADSLSLIQGRGELPTVALVQPSANPTPPANQDEGTMMLEEVHAVAPGAGLAFCGPQTYVEYVACVQALIAAKVTVITDDLLFPGGDVMSAPAINLPTQAIASLLAANPAVMLFSSAENNAKNYWQGNYTPVATSLGSLSCQGQTDSYFNNFTPTYPANNWGSGGATASDLRLAWVNASGVSAANYDLYVLDQSLNVVACAAGSTTTQVQGATTYDLIPGSNLSSPNFYYILIGTPDTSLSGNFLKLLGFGDNADQWSSTTPGSTSSPQNFAAGVFSIGAVDGGDGSGNNIEPFSATGPVQFALPTPSTLQAPMLVAPDDIFVDNVGTSFQSSMFSGTSAASPNSAAVAALILSAFPNLTSAQAISAMQSGAVPLGAPGTFGYGRVDAIGTLGALAGPTISGFQSTTIVGGNSSAALPITVGGTGVLSITATPANLISGGPPGVVLAPASCGNPTTACTLTLTPIIGQTGSTTVQLTVSDGAKRSMSYQASVTVTKPAAPTVSISSGGHQNVNLNGAIAAVMFTLSGTGPLTFASNSNGFDTATITPGCGTTTLTCTAMLGSAASSARTATLTLTVQDAYSQSGSATATVTESAPSGGGGGTMDSRSLLALLILVALGKSAPRMRTRRSASERRAATS